MTINSEEKENFSDADDLPKISESPPVVVHVLSKIEIRVCFTVFKHIGLKVSSYKKVN